MARPKKPIDPEQVRKLAAIACTVAEMAAVLDCDKRTLERRFAAMIEKGREEGCASLKRKQFETAMAGNPTMLIWLGKQRLGQKDTHEIRGAADAPIAHTHDHTVHDVRERLSARLDRLARAAERN